MERERQQFAHSDRRAAFSYTVLALLALVLVLGALAVGSTLLEQRMRDNTLVRGDLSAKLAEKDTLVYQGNTYIRNERLTTILLIGTDRELREMTVASRFRGGGQADFLGLVVMDHERKTVRWISIDRDTMTEIMVLGVLGNSVTPTVAQICLAQGFGSSEKENCRSTVQAVEGLMKGVQVDFFASFDLASVATLNNAVGGVEVTLEEDFTYRDPSMAKGATLTLSGEQAEIFVHERMAVGDGRNESRMHRQSIFLDGLSARLLAQIKDNPQFIGTLYDLLGDHLVTNMKRGRIINESNRGKTYQHLDDGEIPGLHIDGDSGFMEFYPDEEALQKLVVDVFYQPVSLE